VNARFLRRWWLAAALGAIIVVVGFAFGVPALNRWMVSRQMTGTLANVRTLQTAITMMALDTKNSGEPLRGGLPADVGAKSAREYLRRLTENNYLSEAELRKLWMPGRMEIVNVASGDPPDTAFIILKTQASAERIPTSGFVVMTLGGDGGSHTRSTDGHFLKLPARTPQILPDE
jgi:hypothetical protein